MTEFDPTLDPDAIDTVRQRWRENTDTFGRVYDTILAITTPTPYADIAETAECSPNAAKKHLERLVEMGIARTNGESRPARYERNEGYLEWQEASRIAAGLAVDDIIERVQRLETHREEFEDRFETTDPSSVEVFAQDNHEAIHERMEAVSEWHAVERDIRLYELARQLAQNDGHLVPA
jgi:predicted ArsR family transcriptional regulator